VLLPWVHCALDAACGSPSPSGVDLNEREREKWLLTLGLKSMDPPAPTCTHGPLHHGIAIRLDLAPYHKKRVAESCKGFLKDLKPFRV
jgi:hypothetical protein